MANIRPLSPKLAQHAEKIINEVPEQIKRDLDYLKEWLAKQPHLKVRMDDQWLIAFLRTSKYSLERTKEKLDAYYTLQDLVPEIFRNRDTTKGQLKDLIHTCTVMPIEDEIDATRPFIIYYRLHYDPSKIDIIEGLKYSFLTADIFLYEFDRLTVNGLTIISDLERLTVNHVLSLTPMMIKKFVYVLEKAYPLRVKSVHFINCPPLFERIFKLIKMFCTPKLASRINVHTGVDTLFDYIPQRLLPCDLGGEGPSREKVEGMIDEKLKNYEEWFRESENFGTDEKLRSGKPKTVENFLGVEGSFRKLAVD